MNLTSLYGPVPTCDEVFERSDVPEYVSLGTMKQHCVASTDGHVTCGDLRWNVTAYWPFVVTLSRLPSSGDGEFAAACALTALLLTRSIENFTSAESNAEPSWNLTPVPEIAPPRLQRPDREALRRKRRARASTRS